MSGGVRYRRWEATLVSRSDAEDTWQAGVMLSRYERRPDGPDDDFWGDLHAHYTGGFVSVLLRGRYLEHIARGVRERTTGQKACESFHEQDRRSGSVRLYRERDYHEIRVVSPVAWSICFWWGRYVFGDVKTEEVRR